MRCIFIYLNVEPIKYVQSLTCTMISSKVPHGIHVCLFVCLFSRTYFDNIVAIDSLLEHIMVGVFSLDCDFL